jgi:hypothetical protein
MPVERNWSSVAAGPAAVVAMISVGFSASTPSADSARM